MNGFIPKDPSPRAYLFGSLTQDTNFDNINWENHLPTKEYQKGLYFDTWNCVAESATNCLETQFTFRIDTDQIEPCNLTWLRDNGYFDSNGKINFSARFIGSLAGTEVGVGNSGECVATTIINYGLIPESKWEFNLQSKDKNYNNEENYYKRPNEELIKLGKEFLKRFKLYFEAGKVEDSTKALKDCTPQIFVNGYYKKNDKGEYINPTGNINHAVEKFEDRKIFDTYNPTEKTMSPGYIYNPWFYKFIIKEVKQINMTNAKILKDKNSSAVGVWLPAINPDALKSYFAFIGREIPELKTEEDWKNIVEGEFELN